MVRRVRVSLAPIGRSMAQARLALADYDSRSFRLLKEGGVTGGARSQLRAGSRRCAHGARIHHRGTEGTDEDSRKGKGRYGGWPISCADAGLSRGRGRGVRMNIGLTSLLVVKRCKRWTVQSQNAAYHPTRIDQRT